MTRIFKNPFSFLKIERNALFDFLKLVAMLLVVLDHCLQRWVPNIQDTRFYTYIFLTQMPIFMFVSGFFAFKKVDKIQSLKQLGIAILNIIIALLLPFVTFSIIISFINSNSFKEIAVYFINAFINPQYSLWFLWVLFWIECLFLIAAFIGNTISKAKKMTLILTGIFFIFLLVIPLLIHLKWNIFDTKLIIYYSIFFIFGLAVNFLLSRQMIPFFKKDSFKIILLILSICVLTVVIIARPAIIHDEETPINMCLRVFGSFASIAVLSICGWYITKKDAFRKVSKFGRLSLEFYFVHLLLIRIPLFNIQFSYNFFANVTLYMLLYVFLIILALIAILGLKSITFTDLIFFGKNNFKKQREYGEISPKNNN